MNNEELKMSKGGGQMKVSVRGGVQTTEEGKARYELKDRLLLVCDAICGMVREQGRDKR